MASTVAFSHGYFPSPTRGRPIPNAQIYIGQPDLDPEIPANQKQVSVRQEDGTVVPIAQPLRTGTGGVPIYNGSSVTPLVDGNYSMKVLDSNGALIYNIAQAAGGVGTAIGDLVVLIDDGGGNGVFPISVIPALPYLQNVVEDTTPQLGGILDSNGNQIRDSKGADVASATNLIVGSDGNTFDVTGTTNIETIDTKGVGTIIRLTFDGILDLIHSSTDLILPGAANITTAVGDIAIFEEYQTGDWRCINYQRADGRPVVDFPAGLNIIDSKSASDSPTIDFASGIDSTYNEYRIPFQNAVPVNDGVPFWFRTSADGTTYDAGASDYDYAYSGYRSDATGISGNSAGNSQLALAQSPDVGSSINETGVSGEIRIYRPSVSQYCMFQYSISYVDINGFYVQTTGGGRRLSASSVVGVRFLFGTANIESGEFQLFGVRKAVL